MEAAADSNHIEKLGTDDDDEDDIPLAAFKPKRRIIDDEETPSNTVKQDTPKSEVKTPTPSSSSKPQTPKDTSTPVAKKIKREDDSSKKEPLKKEDGKKQDEAKKKEQKKEDDSKKVNNLKKEEPKKQDESKKKEDGKKTDDAKKTPQKKDDSKKDDTKKQDVKKDVKKEDVKKDSVKKEDTKKPDETKKKEPKKEDVKKEDVKKEPDSNKSEPLKKDDTNKQDIKQEDTKTDVVKKEEVKQENAKTDSVKKEDTKKEDSAKKDSVKKAEEVKKDSVKKVDDAKKDNVKKAEEAKKVVKSEDAKKSQTKPKPVKKPKQNSEDSSSSSSDSGSDSESDRYSSSSSSGSSGSSSSSSSSSESDSEDDSEDDVPLAKMMSKKTEKPKKKKKKEKSTEQKTTPKKTSTPSKKRSSEKSTESEPKRKKKEEEPIHKWWLEPPLPEGKTWKTLSHNGVVFPDPYKPHGVKMLYDGKPVDLTPQQEEVATFFSQYIESDHVQKPQFSKNFFNEFLKVLNKGKKKEIKKARSKEEKQAEKAEKDKQVEKYGFATVDGFPQKLANFRIEPPGLFLGRGNHPKAGMLKKRIQPEDVTINISKDSPVPSCPLPDHKWGKIIHNDEVAWLATWKDEINNHVKYVWLAPSSRVKGESDMRKFETARRLKKHSAKIREHYTNDLSSKDMKVRQKATATYLIDRLALRVGNEKGEDEADTVGCCSLRTEHVKLKEPDTVEFDFLGKDSMRYQNSVQVSEKVFKNLKLFTKDKKKAEDIFDQLTTTALNQYLKDQMDGLTAKVFRTYNASITLQNELEKMPDEEMTVDEKMLFYNRANREVAILCNHQRTVSKNFSQQMGKIDDKLQELEDRKEELKEHLADLKSGKKRKREEPEDDDEDGKKRQKLPDDPNKCKAQIEKIKQQIAKWDTKKTEKDELKTVALSTSKINYIDPRISVAWAKTHNVPIERIFSKALRQKFPWAMDVDHNWKF